MGIDELIKSKEWIIRDVNRWHGQCTISMHRSEDYVTNGLLSQDEIEFFKNNPFGETDEFIWNSKRVDEIWNVHIWKV